MFCKWCCIEDFYVGDTGSQVPVILIECHQSVAMNK